MQKRRAEPSTSKDANSSPPPPSPHLQQFYEFYLPLDGAIPHKTTLEAHSRRTGTVGTATCSGTSREQRGNGENNPLVPGAPLQEPEVPRPKTEEALKECRFSLNDFLYLFPPAEKDFLLLLAGCTAIVSLQH